MIDVFMLLRENILVPDPDSDGIIGVQFCECEPEDFTAIRDLVAREDAGFLGRLEEITLFQDDEATSQYPTDQSISEALALEDLDINLQGRLRLKRTFQSFVASFPFDYLNLDFCEPYYNPPNWMKVNETVRRFLEWQRNGSEDGSVVVDDFVMAITCRLDDSFPDAAARRLAALVVDNCKSSKRYDEVVNATRGRDIPHWLHQDPQDFFHAAWPKDIARLAKEVHWKTEILDYVYYDRTGDSGNAYVMVCLVARFTRDAAAPDYIPAALHALDRDNRHVIRDLAPESRERRELRQNLREIVVLRNEQAARFGRHDLLPDPRP
ncbi:MAG TPA: hypothetical protein VHS78_09690 [Candidatus Elarobacter sp.]|nr:hypothetical protein [Candidatus Elarobacter sp.]